MSGLGLPGDLYGNIMPTQVKVNNTTPIYVPTGGTSATLLVSSLTVSSINGASPGGGGTLPANPTFSSITTPNSFLSSVLLGLSSLTLGATVENDNANLLELSVQNGSNYGPLGCSSLQVYGGAYGANFDAQLAPKGLTVAGIQQPFIQSGFGLLGNDGFSTFILAQNYANTNYIILANYDNVSTVAPLKPLGTYVGLSGGKSVSSFSLNGDVALPIQWTTLGNI